MIIISVLFIPYAPDLGKEARYVYALNKLQKDSFDIAFFGNSYSFTAYDPTIIENELGLKSIHLNSSSQKLTTSLLIARYLIPKSNFKYIVFDVSEPTFIVNDTDEKSWYYQSIALQEIPFSFEKFNYLSKFFPEKNFTKYYITALSKNVGRLFNLNDRSNYKVHEEESNYKTGSSTPFAFNGFLAKNHSNMDNNGFIKESNKPIINRMPSDSLWNNDMKDLMQKVIVQSKKNGIQILLINSLKLHKQLFKDSYLEEIVANNNHVSFLDLNTNKESYFLNEKSFYNFTHLSYQGSYEVTHRLVDSMANYYSLTRINKKPINFKYLELTDMYYNLSDDQDKFIKLEFDNIPEILKNHQLVVSFFPKDTSLLSDYSKKKKFGSDNFYAKLSPDKYMDLGNSKIVIMKLNTKITESELKKLRIYFYKQQDALGIPKFEIVPSRNSTDYNL